MNNTELTDMQRACLLIVRTGKDHELSDSWKPVVVSLLDLKLIQFKPNTTDELMLTITGEDCLMKGIMIKYPLHVGNIGSYNNVVRSMEPTAINALVCAMMNERCFDKVPKKTARTLGQHLLDINFYFLWGSILIGKYLKRFHKSMEHFQSMDEKYGRGEDKYKP
jgi:hypothetical protein